MSIPRQKLYRERALLCLLAALLLANMAFIWYNSALPAEKSSAASSHAADTVVVKYQDLTGHQMGESSSKKVHVNIRTYAHAIEFFPLGLLACWFIHILFPRGRMWFISVLAVLFGWLCALSDEFHQLFVPGRGFEWQDIGKDMTGFLAGLILALAVAAVCRLLHKNRAKRAEGCGNRN